MLITEFTSKEPALRRYEISLDLVTEETSGQGIRDKKRFSGACSNFVAWKILYMAKIAIFEEF